MSSDRLSFNQGADDEDDGARWEAYLALLRRTGAELPSPEAEEADEAEDEIADHGDPLAEPGLSEPPDPVEAPVGASEAEDLVDAPAGEPLDEPLRLDDRAVSVDIHTEGGATVAPRKSPRAAGSIRRNSRLVIWTMALTAGIIFAALLVPRQHDQRDVRTPSKPPSSQPGHQGLTGLTAGTAAPIAPPQSARPQSAPPQSTLPVSALPLSAPPAPAPAPKVVSARLAPMVPHLRPHPPNDLALRPRDGGPGARASYQSPQCWATVATPDHTAGEARLTACPSFGPPSQTPPPQTPPSQTTAAVLRWQATPTPAPRPAPRP